ncbi:unnamed protein product [Discula destructiva]
MAEDTKATRSHSVLFQNKTRTVVLIDVPRSIEEAQVLSSDLKHGSTALKRLVSSKPLEQPFSTPEPQDGNGGLTDSVSDLMSAAAVEDALELLRESYSGPLYLPRIVVPEQIGGMGDGLKRKRQTSPDVEDTRDETGKTLIPQASVHFLHGTISSERERFLKEAPIFEFLVLDPPWPNRSARRKKNSYRIANNLDEIRDTLSLIPLTSHLAPDGLVAVWVTNKTSVITLMTGPRGIFAEWGLELVDEWTWLKVTAAGAPIVDLSSRWRKPWERLLIARRRESTVTLPIRGKVLVSVPDVHSRKPSLRGLFDEVFGPGYKGLEIFARHLTAGWWSWGDEVLKFQQPEHWRDPIA